MTQVVDKGTEVGTTFLQIIGKIIGVVLLFGGVIAISVLLFVYSGNIHVLPFFSENSIHSIPTLLELLYPDESNVTFIFALIISVSIIPIILGILTGLKLLFKFKQQLRVFFFTLLSLWAIAITLLMFNGISLATHFNSQGETTTNIALEADTTQVLNIDATDEFLFSRNLRRANIWNSSDFLQLNEENVMVGHPTLSIYKTHNPNFEIILNRKSLGYSKIEAVETAKKINYTITTNENNVTLPGYYSFNRQDNFRMQQVIVEIYVPIGKRIKFGDNIDRMLMRLPVSNDDWQYQYANTIWEASALGFNRIYRFEETNAVVVDSTAYVLDE